jgi:hypothetical protein
LAVAAKVGFDEFNQGQKAAAQTNAVLKSTGGVAGVTAGQVDNLANSLLQKSGVDDEVIKSGENVLLTFTNVHNEAGRGGDIFNRATKAALDFSTATGRDMASSSRVLGKALNDPIKGMSQLGRVGVTFTDAQKQAIASMVKGGNVAGAQAVILGELEKRFGGSAEAAGGTFAGKVNIARENLKNFAGTLVGAAMPALTALAGALGTAAGWMQKHETITKVVIGTIAAFAVGVLALRAAMVVASVAQGAMTAAQVLLNVALTANPIGLVIIAIAGLVAGLVVAWQHSATFRGIVTGAFDAVAAAARGVWNAISTVIDWVGNLIHNPAVKIIGAVLGGPFILALTHINDVIGAIHGVISAVQTAIGWLGKLGQSHGYNFAGGLPAGTAGSNKAGPPAPHGATGGIVNRPTFALIGEAGPEAVIPLDQTPGNGPISGLGGGGNVYITVNGFVGDEMALIDRVRDGLIRGGRRMPGVLGGLA